MSDEPAQAEDTRKQALAPCEAKLDQSHQSHPRWGGYRKELLPEGNMGGEVRTAIHQGRMEGELSERATSGGTFRKTSRHCPIGGSDYGYILHPDPIHWGGRSEPTGVFGRVFGRLPRRRRDLGAGRTNRRKHLRLVDQWKELQEMVCRAVRPVVVKI